MAYGDTLDDGALKLGQMRELILGYEMLQGWVVEG
jgi:hypothetical protein